MNSNPVQTGKQKSISTAPELTSLNLEQLDIQELERRLELASATASWPCGIYWIDK